LIKFPIGNFFSVSDCFLKKYFDTINFFNSTFLFQMMVFAATKNNLLLSKGIQFSALNRYLKIRTIALSRQ